MKVWTVLRQGFFSWRVVNAWNGLPRKVVVALGVNKLKWDLDSYLDVLEVVGCVDIGLCVDG